MDILQRSKQGAGVNPSTSHSWEVAEKGFEPSLSFLLAMRAVLRAVLSPGTCGKERVYTLRVPAGPSTAGRG